MDISKLPIGSYRLDVQATDSTGKSTACARQISRSKSSFAPRFLCLKHRHFDAQEFFRILPEIANQQS
jgi:hypothetical protein